MKSITYGFICHNTTFKNISSAISFVILFVILYNFKVIKPKPFDVRKNIKSAIK